MTLPPAEFSSLTKVAISAAQAAGNLLRKGFETRFRVSDKGAGVQNLVTEYDLACERAIFAEILSQFPTHAFLAEESGRSSKATDTILWLIDPLDGTVNFAHSLPLFCTSIAATKGDDILCGVIYNPLLDELFVAEKGKGAFLNGKPLKVSSTNVIEKALVGTGFPYDVGQNPEKCLDRYVNLSLTGCPIRDIGSAALSLAYLSAGRLDGYWMINLQPWDVAAGMLILQEAGGQVTDLQGAPHYFLKPGSLLASNGHLHDALLKTLS